MDMHSRSRASRLRTGAVGLAAALVATLTTFAGVAHANLACGSVVTSSTTLTHDIGPCSSDGLIIAADNIVLDLGGHRVFGTAAQFDGAGVLFDGVSGSTVRNGWVTDFDGGVVVDGGGSNTIESIVAKDNIGEFTQGFITDYGDGILVLHSSDNVIRNNLADHNGPFAGITVLGNSFDNVVEGNTSQNNTLRSARPGHGGGFDIMEDDGIRVENFGGFPDGTIVRNNTVRDNGLDGIAVFAFIQDVQVIGNVVTGNGSAATLADSRKGDGIRVFPGVENSVVMNNRVLNNAKSGVVVDASATSNEITRNLAFGNGVDPGLGAAWDLEERNFACDNNTWANNRFGTSTNPGAPCIS